MNKSAILDALDAFTRQRPGLEFGNYGCIRTYRAELRGITKDLHHARDLLTYVACRDSITAERILDAARSGRLSIVADDSGAVRIDYCTGQYWPTEYRRAVCALLASVVWAWWFDECMPAPTLHHNQETGELVKRYRGLRANDWLRNNARREFGRAIASRFFN